jgi:hypothetical protein
MCENSVFLGMLAQNNLRILVVFIYLCMDAASKHDTSSGYTVPISVIICR